MKQQAFKSPQPSPLNHEVQEQLQKGKVAEEKLQAIQRIHNAILQHFSDLSIGTINKEMKLGLINGTLCKEGAFNIPGMQGRVIPFFDVTSLTKIAKAFDGEIVYFNMKSNDKYYKVTAIPLRGFTDNIDEILCVMLNVTEQKKLEENLLQALEKEKELGELKSRFVTMASHEFRTPLTSILASAFVLENYNGDDFEKEKAINLNRIKRSVNNLTAILNEFLSLQKLEENKIKLVYTRINVPEYIQDDLIGEIEVLKKPGQEIIYKHLGSLNTAQLDHQVFWSIVTNLLSNSLKYSKANDKIEITSEIKNNQLELVVKDPGIGIPQEEHKYIFDRFYRASNALNIEGTGLGLHIVQKYVQLLNGTITFESQINMGTRFIVVLPDVGGKIADD